MLFVSFSIEQNEVLIFQRQTLKEEFSYARHDFQSADDNPEWNSTKTPVIHNGFDLMTLHTGSDVAVFSRLLGSKFFSSSEKNNRIVSPQKNSENCIASKELDQLCLQNLPKSSRVSSKLRIAFNYLLISFFFVENLDIEFDFLILRRSATEVSFNTIVSYNQFVRDHTVADDESHLVAQTERNSENFGLIDETATDAVDDQWIFITLNVAHTEIWQKFMIFWDLIFNFVIKLVD